MKKNFLTPLLLIVLIICAGCNNKKISSTNQSNSGLLLRNQGDSNKIVDTWLKEIHSDNPEKYFDPKFYDSEACTNTVKLLSDKYAYRVFFQDESMVYLMIITEDSASRGTLVLSRTNNQLIATVDSHATEMYNNYLCRSCNGSGFTIINSTQKTGKYSCSICNGTGWQQNQYYDAIMGWKSDSVICSACGGVGWIVGPHTIYDYGFCDECEGFGIKEYPDGPQFQLHN